MFYGKDPAVTADQRMTGYTGLRAAMEARLVEFLSVEELDNHEPFSRPVFVWKDTEDEVAPEPAAEWFEVEADRLEVHGSLRLVQGKHSTERAYGNSADLVGWDAIDQRLSEELAEARRAKCEGARIQWSTDKVSRAFFEARTQDDLDEAFALMAQVKERGFIADGIITSAKARVRGARQVNIDQLRELNRKMAEEANRHRYRVPGNILGDMDGDTRPVGSVRQKEWCLFRPENWPADSWKVGRGSDLREGATVLATSEPRLLGILQGL